MDWLDDMVGGDKDAERLARLLQTPDRKQSVKPLDSFFRSKSLSPSKRVTTPPSSPHGTPKSNNRKGSKQRQNLPSANITEKINDNDMALEPKRLLFASDSTAFSLFEALTPFDTIPTASNSTLRKDSGTPERTKKSKASVYKRSLALGNGWNAKGLQKAKKGLWKDALSCWEMALDIRLQLPPTDSQQLDVANTYNNRGIALSKLGVIPQALTELHQALEIRSSKLGPSHPQVIGTYHNIANVHQQAREYDLALQVFIKAKEACRCAASSENTTSAGVQILQMARICAAMGHLYNQVGQWVDARDAYQDALELYGPSPSAGNNDLQGEILDLERDMRELGHLIQKKGIVPEAVQEL